MYARKVYRTLGLTQYFHCRRLQHHARLQAVKSFHLADIGEGITECQLIQWFVQPGARVEQFDKICEVQSDKASVEITSPYDGIIKKLHYETDDMAITGRPLVDIDSDAEDDTGHTSVDQAQNASLVDTSTAEVKAESGDISTTEQNQSSKPLSEADSALLSLATPAVRHLMKELDLNIQDVQGSGKDGRVLREDIQRHVTSRDLPRSKPKASQEEKESMPLSPIQSQMFKVMTRSLNIPHFLFSSTADMSGVTAVRQKLNASRTEDKVTSFAFIIKAVSIAFREHGILNATLDTSDSSRPMLTYHSSHNFGIAVDTPSGLLVPVIRDVQNLSIDQIAEKLRDISKRARNNGLLPNEFQGATFTLSNIGSVGGGVVSPVISEPQVAIVGIGRSKIVPAFDSNGELCKREELVLSWSADHRIVNGAECARCAEHVKALLENPGLMMVEMR